MKVVLQRVAKASVLIDNSELRSINQGLLILLGIEHEDTEEDIDWLINKILNLRIFNDEDGKMNLSIKSIGGEVLIVSQFTLYASTKKGNRPSFIQSAKPTTAIPLYNRFIQNITKRINTNIQTGKFGANMKISLENDGPVTIIIDSKNRI